MKLSYSGQCWPAGHNGAEMFFIIRDEDNSETEISRAGLSSQ